MKKLSFALLLYLTTLTAIAGYNDNQDVSEYDLETGIYIHGVTLNGDAKPNYSSKSADYSPKVNLFVFNPKDNTYRHLLDKNYDELTNYVIESAFNADENQVSANSIVSGSFVFLSGNNKLQNNTHAAKRAINQNIILETYSIKTKEFTVWKANKLAGQASVMFSYHLPSEWHLDVSNQKIRLMTPGIENGQTRLRIKSYDW
jgi:hypothetical protein